MNGQAADFPKPECPSSSDASSSPGGDLSSMKDDLIKQIIAEVGASVEDALKAAINSDVVSIEGKPYLGVKDFAYASAGARIVDKLTSPTFKSSNFLSKFSRYTGIGWENTSPPEVAISGGRKNPGDCWPMEGAGGNLTVKLIEPIVPRAITVEHIPKDISPVGVKSALHRFRVWGRADEDSHPVLLGPPSGSTPFEYNVDDILTAQQFPLSPPPWPATSSLGNPGNPQQPWQCQLHLHLPLPCS